MIKSGAILALVYCVMFFLRRRPAAERHMIWVIAIGSAALLPLLTLLLPSWQPEAAAKVAGSLPELLRGPSFPAAGGEVNVHAIGIEPDGATLILALRILWIMGSAVALVLFLTSCVRLKWIASQSRRLSGSQWTELTSELTRELMLKRTIDLRRIEKRMMPMTWGLLYPRVLLPASSEEWSLPRKRIVLAHELTHIQRADWLFQIMAELACIVYWFNPFFWIARNRLDFESERACDDAVLNLGFDGQDYATHLFEIARALKKQAPAWLPALAMAKSFRLESRLAAILNSRIDRRKPSIRMACVTIVSTLCLVVPFAALHAPLAAADTIAPEVIEYTTPPLYSDDARSQGIEGTVRVQVRVDGDGRARDLRVIKGLGFGLDENALVAVREWKFSPGKRDGKAVETTREVGVEFSLRNAELNEAIANDMATRVGPGIVPPRIIHRVEPHTSTRAGTVVLDAVIQENGVPKVVRVVRSLSWELDESAINALKQWRFSPAMKDGQPVKVRMNVAMSFGDSQNDHSTRG